MTGGQIDHRGHTLQVDRQSLRHLGGTGFPDPGKSFQDDGTDGIGRCIFIGALFVPEKQRINHYMLNLYNVNYTYKDSS